MRWGLSPSGKVSEILGFLGTGLGLQLGNRPLMVLGLCLFLPALYALVRTVVQVRGVSLEVRRPRRARAQEPSPVHVCVRARRGVTSLSIQDATRPRLGMAAHAADLHPGEVRRLRGKEVFLRRGLVRPGPVAYACSRPLGLAGARRELPTEQRIIVLPPVGRVSGGLLELITRARPAGMHSHPRRGLGAEIHTLRSFHPGDSWRHIHWATTARTGELMVRECEDEEDTGLLVLGVGWRSGREDRPTGIREATLSLACTLLNVCNREVLLLLPGERPLRVPVGDRAARGAAEERLALMDDDPGWPEWGAAPAGDEVGGRVLLHPGEGPPPALPSGVRVVETAGALRRREFIPRGGDSP